MTQEPHTPAICSRIAQLRLENYGRRGKASFCSQLGLSTSTYNYYEYARIPPAEVLVRIADVTGTDLRWLLTGDVTATPVPASHPAVQRVAQLLREHPDAAAPLAAFVEILSASLAWPAKAGDAGAEAGGESAGGAPAAGATSSAPGSVGAPAPAMPAAAGVVLPPVVAGGPRENWIPILGRSAAGVPAFWREGEDSSGVTLLSELVERHARRVGRQVQPASAVDSAGLAAGPVQIVSLSAPDAQNVAEFVVARELRQRHADAFAVRIDGESMSPEIRHGDIVVCAASIEAADGQAALVQLDGQIGVTCKIVRRQGQTVHLVPINEQYAPQSFPAERVVWARRVLARVRPGA